MGEMLSDGRTVSVIRLGSETDNGVDTPAFATPAGRRRFYHIAAAALSDGRLLSLWML